MQTAAQQAVASTPVIAAVATAAGGGCVAALCAALWQTRGPITALTVTAVLPAVGITAAWRRDCG
ncbi:hypothetical protein [Micromonospora sp. LOL_024]|uniref:hypothetical protein n=1 Tax=Micromonospora sp. LOL_024 TaxID=3345412 RepID=UPI003A89DDCE